MMADATTSHIVNFTHRTLRSPHLRFSPVYSKKWNKRELTIPLNQTNIPMSGINTGVFFAAVMPGLYAQCLSLLTEPRKRLVAIGCLAGMGGSRVLRGCLMWVVGVLGCLLGRVLSKRKRREGGVSFQREQGNRHLAWVGELCRCGRRGSWTILCLFCECRISILKTDTTRQRP
ncbi:unnamed protein product [Tuber aestivum]|uniref:Uncharacterized protein n=1 Tax=Tuber aestivum TaxID=59557 RepID=A0A292PUZ7_9PEZI|nr:unnamed protein product [Tuber aestivum]